MSYTDEELLFLAYVPQIIGAAAATASRSGVLGTGKELFASTSSMLEGAKSYPHNALIRQLVSQTAEDRAQAMIWMKKSANWAAQRLKAKRVDSVQKLAALAIDDAKAASTLLASKSTPAEANEYKEWAVSVGERVVHASTEGGFLGFGGERVTIAEKALIDRLRSALDMAAGEPENMLRAVANKESAVERPLAGRKVIITAGPTHELIGMDHYITKRSTGEQGYLLAGEAVALGAETILVSGPVNRPLPPGAQVMPANTALDMLRTCERELPCDIFIAAAEISKWRLDPSGSGQLSKSQADHTLELKLIENPSIVHAIGTRTDKRPMIVVAFTAETASVIEEGRRKRAANACDLVIARDVNPSGAIVIRDRNTVHLISEDDVETWPRMSQREIARKLLDFLAAKLVSR